MLRKSVAAIGAAVLLAGCSTTVPGTPEADPSAMPKPDTGSFSTVPRTLAAPSERDGQLAEAIRMIERVPLILEADPKLHYGGSVSLIAASSNGSVLKNAFGESAGRRLSTAQIGVMIGSNDTAAGQGDFSRRNRRETVALLRFASPEAASAAVSPEMLGKDPAFAGVTPPNKNATGIPGYSNAIAYTSDWGGGVAPLVAYLAVKQYVIAVYGDYDAVQVQKFFDLQKKGLEGFDPTPIDKLTALPLDPSGLAKYTLPQEREQGYSAQIRAILPWQTDIERASKTFADAGVDQFARGGSTIYRAANEESARHVLDEFVKETADNHTGVETAGVKGVPGGKCVTYARTKNSKDKSSYCIAAAGRFVVEFTAPQQQLASQGIGAAYLIALQAK